MGKILSARRLAYQLFENNWRIRRRVMFAALTYIAVTLLAILASGDDLVLYQQVALGLIAAGVSIIGSYVFGAVWDDNNKRSHLSDYEPDETDESRSGDGS